MFLLTTPPAVNQMAQSSSYEFVRPRSESEGCINFIRHFRGTLMVTVAEGKTESSSIIASDNLKLFLQ